MVQSVRALDRHASQLFQWDADNRIVSLPHGKEIWFARLGEDGKFIVVESKPKPRANHEH